MGVYFLRILLRMFEAFLRAPFESLFIRFYYNVNKRNAWEEGGKYGFILFLDF
jgi:hypothetical protein